MKPMQNIESGYVGCDDENRNDMTTQPQWPMDDHQLSQLIVMFPMVQGNGAAMNEGNMNGEFACQHIRKSKYRMLKRRQVMII